MNIKQQIKVNLLTVLLANTAADRDKFYNKEKGPDFDKIPEKAKEGIKLILDQWGSNDRAIRGIFSLFEGISGLHITDYVNSLKKNGIQFVHTPLSVIVMMENNNSCNYQENKPIIVLNGKNRVALDAKTHAPGNNYPSDKASVVPATDMEVHKCIEELKDSELRWMFTNDLFAPIIEPLFAQDLSDKLVEV